MALIDRAKRRIAARVQDALQISSDRERLVEVEQQVQRQAAQLAALEVRFADLLERDGRPAGPDTDAAAEPALLEEVRREHQQVRQRMTLVTNYLVRLERLEEALGVADPHSGGRA